MIASIKFDKYFFPAYRTRSRENIIVFIFYVPIDSVNIFIVLIYSCFHPFPRNLHIIFRLVELFLLKYSTKPYLVLPCQLVCVGIIGNKRVKFPHDRLIPCIEGGSLFSCIIIENTFLFVS